MYKIKLEEAEKINKITGVYYTEILGISGPYISNVLNGKVAAKEPTVKGILSIVYNIAIDDDKMQELLEKHFTKVS